MTAAADQPSNPEETAIDAYFRAWGEIDNLLDDLTAAAESFIHSRPEDITWGHVGDLICVRHRLRQAMEFICPKEPI